MPQIIVRQYSKEPAAAGCMQGKLKVYECCFALRSDEQVRLFGKIIVHDVTRVQSSQQPERVTEILGFLRPRVVHGRSFDVLPLEAIVVHGDQVGHTIEFRNSRKYARLAPQQPARKPSEPGTRGGRVANDSWLGAGDFPANFAKQVLFQ